jgi:signal transduction histidine kinase
MTSQTLEQPIMLLSNTYLQPEHPLLAGGGFNLTLPFAINPAVRYAGTLALVGIALLIRMLIAPPEAGLPFVTFFPTTAIAAIIFGFVPGLLAAVLSSILAGMLFLPPMVADSFTFWSQVVFLGDAVLVCWAIRLMHTYQDRYREALKTLLATNQTLENEIEERKKAEAALEANGKLLLASNEALKQFNYVVSHDLRAPLRTITSYLQLLARDYKGKLDAEANIFIDFTTDAAKRMARLIEDLMKYAQIDTQTKEFTSVSLDELAQNVLEDIQVAILESGASVSVAKLPTVLGDDVQLSQLIQNLVANAIKYRSSGRAAKIAIDCRRDGDFWRISVADNGIGIDPRQFARIFQVFKQLHPSGVYEGTGIGLSICKRVVEHHGGRIWVESEPGQGSTFFFTIPALDPASSCLASSPRAA